LSESDFTFLHIPFTWVQIFISRNTKKSQYHYKIT
jgi:hypothetical protein